MSSASSSPDVGRVRQLWRYPVKSLLGEPVETLRFDGRGAVGDRLYALRGSDGRFASGKNTRRFRRVDGLFELRSRYEGDLPHIVFPDGVERAGDDPELDAELSSCLGEPMELVRERDVSHMDSGSVHLVTTSALEWLRSELGEPVDPRRFRPNLVVESDGEGCVETHLGGRTIAIGDVRLEIVANTQRCRMTGLPQDELGENPRVLRKLAEIAEACFGVYANVVATGEMRVGDGVRLL